MMLLLHHWPGQDWDDQTGENYQAVPDVSWTLHTEPVDWVGSHKVVLYDQCYYGNMYYLLIAHIIVCACVCVRMYVCVCTCVWYGAIYAYCIYRADIFKFQNIVFQYLSSSMW